ncbi:MAG TPA: HepT-like ribonuclease domain-containing protein [Thermoanaerobaculia bacterium]|nr:HepT-like ribonuclease domain-containing protein [Thermoanaerobaculia bacterium]
MSARRAMSYVAEMQESDFSTDWKTQDAVVYRLGVIGEAARWLSDVVRTAIDVDWTAIVGMRHRLFHGYREVKLDVVWFTVSDDLPVLVAEIERYLP